MRDRRLVSTMMNALEAAQNSNGNAILKESLEGVKAMLALEDRNWVAISGADSIDEGMDLEDLKEWSERLTEGVVGSAWLKQGFNLRSSYIWQGGIQYDGISSESRGRGTNVQSKIDAPENQRSFFGDQARSRREKRLYTDGLALWIGNNATKILEAVPLREITGTLSDPDHEDIIWAYRREWQRRGDDGKKSPMTRWYFVDDYKSKQTPTVTHNSTKEKVEVGYTAFDMHVNTVEGWKFGSPDALAAWYWNDIAKRLYLDGVDVSEAMASIIFTASTATGAAGQNASNQFASPMGAGSTAVMGGGNGLATMSSAGKGYDFSHVREIIAVIATSLSLSNIALTSNPGDAGSSYGSASSLDLPVRLAMVARRDEHVELDLRVLRWIAGPGESRDKIKVYFHTLDDAADIYRRVQAIVLKWQQGLMKPEDAAEQIDDVFGLPSGYGIPKGVLIPNNKDSLARRDIDRDGAGSTPSGAQAAAPTQGRGGSQAGGSGETPTDTRSDIQSK